MKKFLRWIYLASASLLFLGSLLVFNRAPTSTLWIVAILAAEWGHYGMLIALVVAALSWRKEMLGKFSVALALMAAFLYATPALRAAFIAASLPERCTDAFGPATSSNGNIVPFRFLALFRGRATWKVSMTEHVYATEGSKQLKLDLYLPEKTTGPRPLILVVHGGSWKGGSKKQLPAINRYFAHEGYAVAAMNYRHAPNFKSPAQVEDVFRALDFLKAHARELGLDASRLVLIGRSAGGQIALSASYAGREPALRGVVGFYAPADLVLGYEHPSQRWVLDSKKLLEDYLGGSPSERPAEYRDGSAINFVNAQTPPTLLIHGELDPIVWPEQSERLAGRLVENERPHLYLSFPWATHGCEANINGPSGQLSLYAIDRFLAVVLPRDND